MLVDLLHIKEDIFFVNDASDEASSMHLALLLADRFYINDGTAGFLISRHLYDETWPRARNSTTTFSRQSKNTPRKN